MTGRRSKLRRYKELEEKHDPCEPRGRRYSLLSQIKVGILIFQNLYKNNKAILSKHVVVGPTKATNKEETK